MKLYDQTLSSISRGADCASSTVRGYADAGLVECIRTTSGHRMFTIDAIEQVKKVYAERLANRGRKRTAA